MTNTPAQLPTTSAGTELTRFNALRHGILSRYTVLPWEDTDEYDTLLAALIDEHQPQGPTEEHLVEELAGVLWRKRRLRLAEAATHRRELDRTLRSDRNTGRAAVVHLHETDNSERLGDAIRASAAETQDVLQDLLEVEAMMRRALDLLDSRRNDAYETALAAIRDDTRQWWDEYLRMDPDELDEGEEPYTATPDSLRRFLQIALLPWFERRKKELTDRPLIREQAFGESVDPDKLDRLGRYEVHLDRKFERTLATLLKLQDLRRAEPQD